MNLVESLIQRVRESQKRILICGDAMVDRWVHGHSDICQDGCRKFVEESRIESPGGAANAARSLDNWEGVCVELFTYEKEYYPVKWRFVEDGRIVFRWDEELESDVLRQESNPIRTSYVLEIIEHSAGVLLSDYDKGFLTPEFITDIAERCKESDIPCVADCKRAPEVYGGCILKGNAEYWKRHCDLMPGRIITCGHADPWITGEDNISGKRPQVPCINHVGAGDCFAAHLVLALAYRFSLKEAAAIAHSAGRVYVQHPHNRPPQPHEIAADMAGGVQDRSGLDIRIGCGPGAIP